MEDDAPAALAALMTHITVQRGDFLSALGPALVASLALGITTDTRHFARIFGVAHALVIREAVSLDGELGLVRTQDRGEPSQRLFLSLTSAGLALTQNAAPAP